MIFRGWLVGVPGSQKEHAPRHVVQDKYGRTGHVNVQNLSMAEKTVVEKKRNLFHVMNMNVQVSGKGDGGEVFKYAQPIPSYTPSVNFMKTYPAAPPQLTKKGKQFVV